MSLFNEMIPDYRSDGGTGRVNPLFEKASFRKNNPIPDESVIFRNSSIPGGGETVVDGIERERYRQFKSEHPNSQHPLIDFLCENPDQKASYDDLSREYPIIDFVFKEDKLWEIKRGVRYLGLKNLVQLFQASKESKPEVKEENGHFESVRGYFGRWREENHGKWKVTQFPLKYQDHNFYSEDGIKQFLVFMTEVFAGRRLISTTPKQIEFSQKETFESVITKKNRHDQVFGAAARLRSDGKSFKGTERKPNDQNSTYKILEILTPNETDDIEDKIGRVRAKVDNFGDPIELVVEELNENGDKAKGEIMEIGARRIKVAIRFELIRDDDDLIRAGVVGTNGFPYFLTELIRRIQKEKGKSYFVQIIPPKVRIYRDFSTKSTLPLSDVVKAFDEKIRKHEEKYKRRKSNPEDEAIIIEMADENLIDPEDKPEEDESQSPFDEMLDEEIQFGSIKRGRHARSIPDSFIFKEKQLKTESLQNREKIYKQLRFSEREIILIEAYINFPNNIHYSFDNIAAKTEIPRGSIPHLLSKIRAKLKGEI